MDRTKALEQLEAVRNESDLADPHFAEALAALEDDATARQEFDRRLQLDGRIATAMQEVEVPAGLREKLVAACESEPSVPAKGQPARSGRWTRRRLLATIGSVAAVLVAGFLLMPAGPRVSFDEICRSAPRTPEDLERLRNGATTFQLTDAPVWFDRLRPGLAWPSTSMPLAGNSEPTSEVISGTLAGTGWVLVATPKHDVGEIPNLTASGTRVTGAYAYRAWEDEQFVYVLFAKGNERQLDRIYRQVYPAATA